MRPHGTWLPPLWAPRLATPATLSLCGASVSHVSPGASLLGWSLCLPGCVSSARLAPSCLGSQVDALPSCPPARGCHPCAPFPPSATMRPRASRYVSPASRCCAHAIARPDTRKPSDAPGSRDVRASGFPGEEPSSPVLLRRESGEGIGPRDAVSTIPHADVSLLLRTQGPVAPTARICPPRSFWARVAWVMGVDGATGGGRWCALPWSPACGPRPGCPSQCAGVRRRP